MPTILKGSDYFGVLTYTGDGAASKTVVDTNAVSFTPDFVWIKGRSGATDHALYDAVRGVQKQIESNTSSAETTETTGLTAFTNGGFTVGNLAQVNTSGATYVAWCWKANGAGSSNTSGTITSTVSVNTTAGFSVVTFTANGVTGATVGHGLGVAPKFMIFRNRNTAQSIWPVYHASIGNTGYLALNTTAATTTNIGMWNNTSPTSTVFTIGDPGFLWTNTYTYVAYCFAEIAGFSKFGSYTGNGSADGPFVATNFAPKWIMIKRTNSTGNWYIWDSVRSPSNVVNKELYPNLSNAEATTGPRIDILANGFKFRDSDVEFNGSGSTYIYAAFAENPAKISNAR